MSSNNTKGKGKKAKRIVLIVSASILGVALIIVAVGYILTAQLSANAVPIVTPPTAPSVSPTPMPTPDLPEITGEPDDIGEDYDDPDVTDTPAVTDAITAAPTVEPTPEPIYKKVPIEENVMNILIIGQDLRPNESGRGRSDSMMILSYNRKEGKASIVSLMRDVWVPIKGHDWNRLNTPFRFGGPGLAVNTINDLFNLDIQNYIIINFDGMAELVDKIGGVDVKITKSEAAFYNKSYKWGVKEGTQRLNGEQALLHARNRKSGGGDFERTRRQQEIMFAVYNKMLKVRDPILLADLIGFMMKNIQTNISADTIFTLGLEVVNKGDIDIKKGRMPTDKTWKYANKGGRSVITIDFEKNTDYLHQLIYEEK